VLSSSLTCTVNTATKEYILTNLSSYIPSALPISFDLSTITNGLVSGSQGTFLITTYMTENGIDYKVDEFTSTSIISMVAGSIIGPSVLSTDYIAFNAPLRYTFTFTPEHTIP